jgi:hypothetical protein
MIKAKPLPYSSSLCAAYSHNEDIHKHEGAWLLTKDNAIDKCLEWIKSKAKAMSI